MTYNLTMLLVKALVFLPCSIGLQHALTLPSGRQKIGRRLNYFTSKKSSLYVHSGERDLWEAQREEAKAALEGMDALVSSICLVETSLTSLKDEIMQVEQDVTRLTSDIGALASSRAVARGVQSSHSVLLCLTPFYESGLVRSGRATRGCQGLDKGT